LASEIAAFGIKVTIEPGGYDTDWRGSSSIPVKPMPKFTGLRDRLKAAAVSRQLGNPATTHVRRPRRDRNFIRRAAAVG
jgi:hypothetical protein